MDKRKEREVVQVYLDDLETLVRVNVNFTTDLKGVEVHNEVAKRIQQIVVPISPGGVLERGSSS